ncbi:hypothetical protein PMAYCL1PPCAC_00027, partial [Pristionchus mayeri]
LESPCDQVMTTLLISSIVLLTLLIQPATAQFAVAPRVSVVPKCGAQLITIEVNFNKNYLPAGRFTDWIIVGVTGRPECRLKGNGETTYVIEIAVFNDPCMTQMPAPGVFQNRVRIGKNPAVILQGDHTLDVKCIYGLPEVDTLPLPVINHNFNIESQTAPPNSALGPLSGSAANIDSSLTNNRPSPGSSSSVDPALQQLLGAAAAGAAGSSNGQQQQGLLPQQQLQQFGGLGGAGSSQLLEQQNSEFGGLGGLGTRGGGTGGSPSMGINEGGRLPILPINPMANRSGGNVNDLSGLGGGLNGLNKDLGSNSVLGNGFPNQFGSSQSNGQFGQASVFGGDGQQQSLGTVGNAHADQNKSSFSFFLLLALLVFIMVMLLLLVLLAFFIKRRAARAEARKNLLVSMPPTSELGKLGLGHLWWSGREAQGTGGPMGLSAAAAAAGAARPQINNGSERIYGTGRVGATRMAHSPADSTLSTTTLEDTTRGTANTSRTGGAGYTRQRLFDSSVRRSQDRNAHYAATTFRDDRQRSRTPPRSAPIDVDDIRIRGEERAIDVGDDVLSSQPRSFSEWRRGVVGDASHFGALKMTGREVEAGTAPERQPERPESSIRVEERRTESRIDENGISSYRSITEIYQAAEQTEHQEQSGYREPVPPSAEYPAVIEELSRCVLSIRGFGPRKLTEQEMGRWRSLIDRDHAFRALLLSAHSLSDILAVTERPEYRHLFTLEKWTQIARCVMDSSVHQRTTNLNSAQSQSALNVYIGNIGSDM